MSRSSVRLVALADELREPRRAGRCCSLGLGIGAQPDHGLQQRRAVGPQEGLLLQASRHAPQVDQACPMACAI